MKIGNRAFWFALSCGLTLVVGKAFGDFYDLPEFGSQTSAVNSQAANTAPTFLMGGRVILNDFNLAQASVLQPDGKFVVAGSGGGNPLLSRYLQNGDLDLNFGQGGKTIIDFGRASIAVSSLALQSDGKLVVAGNSGGNIFLSRHLQNGGLDSNFGNDGIVSIDFGSALDVVSSLTIQPDGKILVAGGVYVGSSENFAIGRLLPDGLLDPGFGVGGLLTIDLGAEDRANGLVYSIVDNKIVIVGNSFGVWGGGKAVVIKLLPNGSFDVGFGISGKVQIDFGNNTSGNNLVVQPDGKVIVVGAGGAGYGKFALARLQPDGILDPTFGYAGTVITDIGGNDSIKSIFLQASGNVVVSGGGGSECALARYLANGSLDVTFGVNGKVKNSFGYAEGLMVQDDEKLVVLGGASLLRFTSKGNLEGNFGPPTNTMMPPPDGYENMSFTLAPNARILDSELAAIGTYDGATLTIVRQSGANPEDVFSSFGYLTALNPGSYFAVDGVTIGQVITNSTGILQLRFLGANATQARVDKAMQQIAYTNTSDRPPAQVLIGWTFDDGNTGAQGTGGALSTTGTVTVNITPVNDPPRLDNPPPAQTAAVGTAFSYTLPANTFSDPDGDSLTYSAAMADNTGIPPWLSFNAASRTFTGTPSQGDVRSLALKVTAKDPSNAEAVAYLELSVQNKPTLTASVTAANKPYDATPAATITACTLTGVINGDSVTCAAGSASFSDPNVGTSKTVTATGITLGGAQAVNYTLSSSTATTTANITQATQAALALQATSTAIYEGTSTTLSAQGGSTLGTITYSVQATNGLTCAISGNQLTAIGKAGTCSVTATRAGDGNYLPVSSSPLAITVTLPQNLLTVTRNGNGAIISSPAGIDCGNLCSAYYDKNQLVTLTAVPEAGFQLGAWGGACLGTGPCVVTMSAAKNVTATFTANSSGARSLTVNNAGNGRVISLPGGIDCGVLCTYSYTKSTQIKLDATPSLGYVFAGWSGDCLGLKPCYLGMDLDKNVSALFYPSLDLAQNLTGAVYARNEPTAYINVPYTNANQINTSHFMVGAGRSIQIQYPNYFTDVTPQFHELIGSIKVQGNSYDYIATSYYAMVTLTHKTNGQTIEFQVTRPAGGRNNSGVTVEFQDGAIAFTSHLTPPLPELANGRWTMWITKGGTGTEYWGTVPAIQTLPDNPVDLARTYETGALNPAVNSAVVTQWSNP